MLTPDGAHILTASIIAFQLVCSNCRVTRKITLEATAESLQQKALCFCALCVTIARNTSALTIATREVLEQEARVAVSSFRSTGSSSVLLLLPIVSPSWYELPKLTNVLCFVAYASRLHRVSAGDDGVCSREVAREDAHALLAAGVVSDVVSVMAGSALGADWKRWD